MGLKFKLILRDYGALIKHRKEACRFYRYWSKFKSCDPNVLQEIWDIYQNRKKQVQQAIKNAHVKKHIKRISLNASKRSKNSKAFWKNLNMFNSNNRYPIQIKDPDNIDNVITDPKTVAKVLENYWKNVGKSNYRNPESNASIYANEIKKLENESVFSGNAIADISFDIKELECTIKQLHNGKACGIDQIPNEFLKKGGLKLISTLKDIFLKVKQLESIPNEWKDGLLRPLHKRNDNENLNNYRGITVNSNVYKLFTAVIERHMSIFCEENNIFGDLQGAFRKGRRLENHIFALKGLCSLRKSKKKKTWLGFIDITKAFDVIDRNQLFVKMWHTGIQGKRWRLLRETYDGVQNKVFFGNFSSNWYTNDTGLKQGCCLSPTTFSIIMTDLISALNDSKLGIPFEGQNIPALLFADDIVLMAESEEQLSEMLKIVSTFGTKWGFRFDPVKSKVMVIGKNIDPSKVWYLGNLKIYEVNEYKYLGIYINRRLSDSFHINKFLLKDKCKKTRNLICSTLTKHCNVKRVGFGNTLYNAKFLPGLLHGAGTFVINTEEMAKNITKMQYEMARDLMQLKCNPAREALFSDLGWISVHELIEKRQIDYFIYMKFSLKDGLHKNIFNALHDEFLNEAKAAWSYFENLHGIVTKYGLDGVLHRNDSDWYTSFLNISNDQNKTQLTEKIQSKSSLNTYKVLKNDIKLKKYLTTELDFYGQRIKMKARMGCLALHSDLKRWDKSDGICIACDLKQEDSTFHRLIVCPLENNARREFHDNIERLCGQETLSVYMQQNANAKIAWILGNGSFGIMGHDIGVSFDKCSKIFLTSIYPNIKERAFCV